MEKSEKLSKLLEEKKEIYRRLDMMGETSNEYTKELWKQIKELDKKIEELQKEIEEEYVDIKGIRKTIIQDRMNTYRLQIGSEEGATLEDVSVEEKTRIEDVLPELEDLIAKSNPDTEYVSVAEVHRRVDNYKERLEELLAKKLELKGDARTAEEIETEIVELEKQKEASAKRMKEYKKSGAYEQEAEEHSCFNALIKRISQLKAEKPARPIEEIEAEIVELENQKEASAKRMKEYKEAGAYEQEAEEHSFYNELVKKLSEIKKEKGIPSTKEIDDEIRKINNRIQELEEIEKLKEIFKGKPIEPIEIPENPENELIIDEEAFFEEYQRRLNDMYAKYFGDKAYEKEYKERVSRYRSHEVDVEKEDITYKTIEDYPEKEEDEKFLLLIGYKEALERITKYEAGDKSVYKGSEEKVKLLLEKDKLFVEGKNHTFDQHKYTQKDLGTMGKYGEKMSYIPKQNSLLKNVGRVVLNVGIWARNVVSPVYRVIGKYVAQPIHRVLFKKEASPYKNNIYHRMIARRDYFADMAAQKDAMETEKRMKAAEEGEKVKPVKHTIRNYFSSRINSVLRWKEGNEAVLRAGKYDIQENLQMEYQVEATISCIEHKMKILEKQIEDLQKKLEKYPEAPNAEEVKKAIESKKITVMDASEMLKLYKASDYKTIKQTDAISDKQHAVASKEVNTLRTTVIRGFAKGLAVKYVGPKIKDWLLGHTKTSKKEWVPEQIEKEWVEGTTEEKMVPIYDEAYDTSKTAEQIIQANDGKEVTMFYSVHGGERAPHAYNISSDDKITAIFQGIEEGGTGLSDTQGLKAPIFVDRTFDTNLLNSNGVLKQGVTLEELIKSVGTGTIDKKSLADVYVAVSDEGWVKLSDLCDGMTIKDKIGEELQKIVTEGHWTEKVIPGYYKDIIVENTRVTQALKTLGIIGKGVLVADGVQDVAENLRNTHTDTPQNKEQPRKYDYDDESGEFVPKSRREYRKMQVRDEELEK